MSVGRRGESRGFTIKASALLSIVAIWAAIIPPVVFGDGEWWSFLFAGLATFSVGLGAWRSLGISRLIAIAGTWSGTAFAVAEGEDWVTVMAFLGTTVVSHGFMRRGAILNGLGIATAWLAVGLAVRAAEGGGSWASVFAFLTAATVANHRSEVRGGAAVLWWGLAGAAMIAGEGYHWLSVIAWLLTTIALGVRGFAIPRRIEWDLFERD